MSSSPDLSRKAIALGRSFSLSALNQAIGSATNLLLSVYFARTLLPNEFGLYGVGFSAALLYSGLGNALVLTQMVVHFPEYAEAQRSIYAARMFWLVLALCLVTAGLACLGFGVPAALGFKIFALRFWLAVVAASVSYLLKDYFVRLAYSQRRESSAIVVNSFVAAGTLAGVLAAIALHFSLSASSALLIFAFGQTAGALSGVVRAGLPHFHCDIHKVPQDLRQAWVCGRWAVGGAVVIWLQSQAYVYITAITVGAAGVGFANAARLFVSPFQSLLPAIGQVMLPRLALLRVSGASHILQVARRYLLAMMSLVALYLISLAVAFRFISGSILGPHYSSLGWLVVLWGVALFAQVSRDSASTSMQALRMFREILVRNVWSALVAVAMAFLLSVRFGAAGAIASIAVGELVLAVLLWQCLRNLYRSDRAIREDAANA